MLCDLEFPSFLNQLEDLEASDLEDLLRSIEKIKRMTWQQICLTSTKGGGKRGLNWEKLEGQVTAKGNAIASIRVTEKHRARVTREGAFMRFISLHPDHDSAYKKRGGESI